VIIGVGKILILTRQAALISTLKADGTVIDFRTTHARKEERLGGSRESLLPLDLLRRPLISIRMAEARLVRWSISLLKLIDPELLVIYAMSVCNLGRQRSLARTL